MEEKSVRRSSVKKLSLHHHCGSAATVALLVPQRILCQGKPISLFCHSETGSSLEKKKNAENSEGDKASKDAILCIYIYISVQHNKQNINVCPFLATNPWD